MRLVIAAIGKLKRGPESDLSDRYHERLLQTGRPLGLRSVEIIELPESNQRVASSRIAEEAPLLSAAIPKASVIVALDPKGAAMTSESFAARLGEWLNEGKSVVFLIGGPDGLAPDLVKRAEIRLAFGAATWPHQLVRIMLLEQLYRATTILTGHPYHRS